MDDELQQLARRLTGLALKRPGLAIGLWGLPGVGKTHAAQTLLRGAACRSQSLHATQPLEGIVRGLPRPKKLALWLERTLERLERGEPVGGDTLIGAISGLLAANAPFILHIEDLHEASDERLEFWRQLAVTTQRLRGVGLLTTSRVEPPAPLEAIHISALDRAGSNALLETEAGATIPLEASAWIYDHAVGNPLFTLEYLRFLARQGALWNDGKRWRWRTPEREFMPITVEALIERMLHDASTPALEAAIGAKAVLGIGSSRELWRQVAELKPKELQAVEMQLERLGLFANDDFAHPLYREVVLQNLTLERQRSLARRALEMLSTDPQAAAEFVEDAGLEASQALGWFERAAQAASDGGNKVQSALFKARAVEYASGTQKGNLALEAAQALHQVNLVKSLELAKVASDVLLNNTEALDLLAKLFAAQRKASEVERTLERLSPEQRNGEVWVFRLLRLKTMMRDFAGILELWKAHPELHSRLSPGVAGDIAFALAQNNRNEEAHAIASEALRNKEASPHERSGLLNVLAILCAFQGNFAEAEVFFGQAVQLVKQLGIPQQIAGALTNHASALRCLGRYHEMMAEYQEAVQLYGEVGDGQGYACNQSLVGGQLAEFGEYEQAEEILQTSLKQLKQGAMDDFLIHCEGNLSGLYQHWVLPQSVVLSLKHAQAALRYARDIGAPSRIAEALSYMATAEVFAGDASKGLELAQEELGIALNIQQPEAIYGAQMARGSALFALGQSDAALEAFYEAEQQATSMGLPLETRKATLEIARITRNVDAVKPLVAWFEERGLMHGVNIARRYFPELAQDAALKNSLPHQTQAVRLEVLGTLQISLEGAITPVRGRKRQELLALLLEARIAGRGEISKLELMDALYPDADELHSGAGLRDVVYQLRLTLGDGALTTTASGYALGNLSSDLEEFLEHGDTSLWRGAYLQGLTLAGSDTVFESVHLALRTRAEILLATDPAEAIRVGRLLCEADPYDLEAVRLTLAGLRIGGNHRSLSRVYELARTRFLEIGETLPTAWQDFLSPVMSG